MGASSKLFPVDERSGSLTPQRITHSNAHTLLRLRAIERHIESLAVCVCVMRKHKQNIHGTRARMLCASSVDLAKRLRSCRSGSRCVRAARVCFDYDACKHTSVITLLCSMCGAFAGRDGPSLNRSRTRVVGVWLHASCMMMVVVRRHYHSSFTVVPRSAMTCVCVSALKHGRSESDTHNIQKRIKYIRNGTTIACNAMRGGYSTNDLYTLEANRTETV